LHPNFYLSRFLDVLVTNHNDFVKISRPDAIIHYYQLTASWLSIFINAPWALCSGLFRPFIIEANGLIPTLASLENLVLLVLTGAHVSSAERHSLRIDYYFFQLWFTLSYYVYFLHYPHLTWVPYRVIA
jgi:hypothetical protein